MFKVKNAVVVNQVATFGKLKFLGLGQERRTYDEETGEIGDVNRRTYDLTSTKLKRVVEVHVPLDLPIIDLPFETEVSLAGLDIRGHNINGRQGWTVRASDIILVEKKAETPKPQQGEPKNK